jgi:hypothetical protein
MPKSLLTAFVICLLSNLSWSQEVQKMVVYFENNQSELSEKARITINSNLAEIPKESIQNVLVIGHADMNGSAEYNKILSKKRAKTTINYLISQGVNQSLISIESKGESQPINKDIDYKEKPVNRRVEIVFTFFLNEENIEAKEITTLKITSKNQNKVEANSNKKAFSIPEAFKINFQQFEINPTKASSLSLDNKGTILHIPANSFVNENGSPVTKNVLIHYREYKNSADMAFSGIPMTYQVGGEEFFFNSAGMFEINGTTLDKKSISVASDKELKIDYALAKKVENIDFFELKGDNWEKVQDIEPKEMALVVYDTTFRSRLGWSGWPRRKLQDRGANKNSIKINVSATGDSSVIIKIKGKKVAEGPLRNGKFEGEILKRKWDSEEGRETMQIIVDMHNPIPIIAEGTAFKSSDLLEKQYSDVIEGLTLNNFGVYNCDQIYNVPNLIMIDAKYIDENGESIQYADKLSMIDLNYNGAFGFEPEHFYFGANSKTVLVIFTLEGKIYLLEHNELAAMNIKESGNYTFKMKNMTETIKSTADLTAYLGL